jgi:cytochrome P450
MSQQQDTSNLTDQEQPLPFPFPFADHSLAVPAEYERLRQQCPVARVKMPFGGDATLLTHHADVVKAFVDPRCDAVKFTDGDVPRVTASTGGSSSGASLFDMSNAHHNQVRRLVTQEFTIKHANSLRPGVIALTNQLIDEMEKKGAPADLFEDYAIKTPMAVICDLLGIPCEDEPLFRHWGRVALSTVHSNEDKDAYMQKMIEYLIPLIERERTHPSNTVLGTLVKARAQGDEVITQQEMLSFAIGLIAAGFETVSTTFTNSAFNLLQEPELLEQMGERVDDPARMAQAIEELFRVTALGGGGRPRITRESVDFSGTHVPSGEVLILSMLSGNFDEEVFPHAREVDFNRETNPIISFGRGIHACIGQQIARMELQVLWSTLLKRLPTIRLAVPPTEVPWRENETLTFGPANLPVTW